MTGRCKATPLLACLLITVAAGHLVGGCAARGWVAPDFDARRPRTLAVLPVVNLSGTPLRAASASSLGAVLAGTDAVARHARRLVANRLRIRGYRIQALETTDRALATAASRRSLRPEQLDRVLGVDAVAEIRVTEWNASMLRISRELEVSMEVELWTAGRTLFLGTTHGGRTMIPGPAGISFRPHLVDAIDDALRGLP